MKVKELALAGFRADDRQHFSKLCVDTRIFMLKSELADKEKGGDSRSSSPKLSADSPGPENRALPSRHVWTRSRGRFSHWRLPWIAGLKADWMRGSGRK
jgi:hypothetical protein